MNSTHLTALIEEKAKEIEFSGVVAVSTAAPTDRVVVASGFADRSNGIANTGNTRFGIASGTKFLTALTIGVLIDSGELGYDTRVKDVMSFDLPRFSDEITVAHLLCHTSGIFDYYDEELVEDFDNFYVDIPWSFLTTPRDYLPLFQNEGMKFRPGERFSYSNGGYILLGIIVEEITGELFRDMVAKHVFSPAGMEDSGFFALNQLPERTATGYMELADGTVQTNVYNLPKIGASDGGAFLTAGDTDRLWRSFMDGSIVKSTTRDEFLTPRATINEKVDYGYGIYIWKELGAGAYFITGCDAGVGFDSRYFADRELTVTILANRTEGEAAMRRALLFGDRPVLHA